MAKESPRIPVWGYLAITCLFIIGFPLLLLLFINAMLWLDHSRSNEASRQQYKLENELEEMIRANKPQQAVDLTFDKEYWRKQGIHLDRDTGIWWYPVYRLSGQYPEYALMLQRKCKLLQADPLKGPLSKEIFCETLEERLQKKYKFENILENHILADRPDQAIDLIIHQSPDVVMAQQSLYALAWKHPAFQAAWRSRCRSTQRIVRYNPSIPDADQKPQNNRGEIRLHPDISQNREAANVWSRLTCERIEDIDHW